VRAAAPGPGAGEAWTGGPDAGRLATQASQAVPPPTPGRRQHRQPDRRQDADEEYDWYRYLSHGGGTPSHEPDSAGPAAHDEGFLAGRTGRAPRAVRKNRDERKERAERKNRDERKTRRDRKNRIPDDGPLTAGQSDGRDASDPDGISTWREQAPAGYADPPGDAAGTGPGHGWRASPGAAAAQVAPADSGYLHDPYPGPAAAWPADPDSGYWQTSYPGSAGVRPAPAADFRPDPYPGPAAAGSAPPDAGHRQPSYPGPAGTGSWAESAPAAYAGPAGTGSWAESAPAAYAGPAGDTADTGPGHGWRAYPGAAAAQAATSAAGYRQPSYPASPASWPGGSPDVGRSTPHLPAQGHADQAFVPGGFEHSRGAAEVPDYGGGEFLPEPPRPAAVVQRPAKRGKKALRPPAARAVRRAAHPDVLARARFAAAAGSAGSAGPAAPPDVAEWPDRAGRPVPPTWPAGPEGRVNPEVPVLPQRPARPARPGGADRQSGAERTGEAGQTALPGRAGRRSGGARSRRRLPRRVLWLTASALVIVAAAVAVRARPGPGPAHVLVTPARLGSYVMEPHLAKVMKASLLQQQIVAKSAGEAKHVVYAVYQDSTGGAAQVGPQIILFIGGNLAGASPGGFISSFIGQARGAQRTSAGSMGGEAACVSRIPGSVAECAWADNDTFGVVASPTLSVSALAAELRNFRPELERPAR